MRIAIILGVLLVAQPVAAEDLPPVADLHCDALAALVEEHGTDIVTTRGSVSLGNLTHGRVMAQVFAIWAASKKEDPAVRAQAQLKAFERQVLAAAPHAIRLARTYKDVLENHRAGKISAMLAMEGADGLGSDARNLLVFVDQGLRVLSITWNYANPFADGLKEASRGGGLTEEGRRLLGYMMIHKVIADMSHLHPVAFWDVVTQIQGPVIATHSNARAIRDKSRNLDDEQILAIAQKQGVIGLVYYRDFVGEGKRVSQDALWDHYHYIAGLVGPEFIALGSDFGSSKMAKWLIQGIHSPQDVPAMLRRFSEKGLDASELDLLASMNFLRMLRTADEEYGDIPPLRWRPLDVDPTYPRPSPPALYDRLSTTAVPVEPGVARYEFITRGQDFFALALRVRSPGVPGAQVSVSVRGSTCGGETREETQFCTMDGSRCVVELVGNGGSVGPCPSQVSVRFEPLGEAGRAGWEILDLIPLQRVILRDP